MKLATPTFLNRLIGAAGEKITGENPVLLAQISLGYPYSGTILVSTERIKIGTNLYNPWVVQFGSIRFSLNEDNFLSSPNSFEMTLIRNSETEKLLNSYQKINKVILKQWFMSLTSESDALPEGTFIVDGIEDIQQSSFKVKCVSDESKLIVELPQEMLNKTDYPMLLNENEDIHRPLVLGKMYPKNSTSDYAYINVHLQDCSPAFCVDTENFKYLAYRHKNVDGKALNTYYAFQYLSGQKLFAELSYFSAYHNPTTKEWQIDIADPGAATLGDMRSVRIMPKRPRTLGLHINTALYWEKACDLDRNSKSWLNSIHPKLSLNFDRIEEPGNYKPLWDPGWYWRAKLAFNLDIISGTVQCAVSGVGYVEFSTPGYKETPYLVSNSPNLSSQDLYVWINLVSGTYAWIDGVHLIVDFWDDMGIEVEYKMRRIPQSNFDIIFKRGLERIVIRKEAEIKLNEIYGWMQGPDDVSGNLWNYDHPINLLYLILNKMAEVDSAEIDASNFNSVYTAIGTGWSFGYFVDSPKTAKEFLQSCLRESNLKMFRDALNKFRIFRSNYAAASPHMVFSDKKAHVYIMGNFKWGYTNTFYNYFDLKYKWDYGKSEYQKTLLKTPDNDSDLGTSKTRYSNTVSEYSYPELDWIRNESVVNLLFSELKKYWKQTKIRIELDTSLVGCLLELGDTIQVDHLAQRWTQASKNFQVMDIEQDNNRVHIRAIEVIP
jgi:hypothetical protein